MIVGSIAPWTATWFGYPGYGCTTARLLNEARGEPSYVVPITSGYSGSGDPVITAPGRVSAWSTQVRTAGSVIRTG